MSRFDEKMARIFALARLVIYVELFIVRVCASPNIPTGIV